MQPASIAKRLMGRAVVEAASAPPVASSSPLVLLPRREVERRVGLSKSAIYDRMQKGTFPPAVRDLDSASVWWVESEIAAWIEARIAARDASGRGTPAARAERTQLNEAAAGWGRRRG